MSELQKLISSLCDYHQKGHTVLTGRSGGVELNQTQVDSLRVECVAIKDGALAIASNLEPGVFDLVLDPIPEETAEENV